jgi:UDP-2,4-diacetamido-2,4,6-trideoxy-beta-L-altropyranose hydrolase/UDP-4-amino-4,6-dideoxy-N-acetyl-beta-L-altrosamine N-acetyltransferase
MRDLVLAQKYSKKGDTIIFATQNLDGNINHKILEANYKLEALKSNDIKEVNKLIKKYNIDMIVIDHYNIDYEYEKQLKEQNIDLKILSFDDTYEKHHCDILLNHNISADKKKYKKLVPKNCKLKCGAKYTLLREEFIKEKNKTYKQNKKFTFFVAMGGADTANINIKILKVLKKYKDIKVNLVTTRANKNLKELKQYCKYKKWIQLHTDSTKIAKLMKKSDCAIVTPSVTLNEVYFMKLPFLAIKMASNQDDIYQYLKKNNLNCMNKFNTKIFEFEIMLAINNITIHNFISLNINQHKQVLKMRNTKSIRQWMYSTNTIFIEDHLEYIELLKIKKDRIYFLVMNNDENIGVVDLTNITHNSAELGIYANPTLYGKGKLLMDIIISYSFSIKNLQLLKANVVQNNTKAIALYEKYNFKKINNQDNIIYMELENENR